MKKIFFLLIILMPALLKAQSYSSVQVDSMFANLRSSLVPVYVRTFSSSSASQPYFTIDTLTVPVNTAAVFELELTGRIQGTLQTGYGKTFLTVINRAGTYSVQTKTEMPSFSGLPGFGMWTFGWDKNGVYSFVRPPSAATDWTESYTIKRL